MKSSRRLIRAVIIAAALWLPAGVAHAQDCQPGIGIAVQAHLNEYIQLVQTISPEIGNLFVGLAQVADQPTYATFLAANRAIANTIPNGRMLIALQDGTVVLDTARPDDPANTMASGNSFQHFQAKTVNENHNSRVGILAAQEYPCGVAVESKLSTTTGQVESYVAFRPGNHLDSLGTARISSRQ